MRRRLETGPDQRDFSVLKEFFAQGATDYFAQLFTFGEQGDSVARDRRCIFLRKRSAQQLFEDNDTTLLRATFPGLSLAMKARAGHVIASALLRTYLGEQTGQRVHAGAIERAARSKAYTRCCGSRTSAGLPQRATHRRAPLLSNY